MSLSAIYNDSFVCFFVIFLINALLTFFFAPFCLSLVWIPAMQDLHQYLQIDFLERKVMWAVGVQGRPHGHAWVSDFYINYGERPDKMAFVRDKFGSPEVGS